MSRRDWLLYIAAIGLAITVCTADAQPVDDNPRSQPRAEQTQTPPSTNRDPLTLESIQDILKRIARAIEAQEDKPKEARDEARANRDLEAQEDMALWALGALVAAGASTALTLVGVVLIWRTLIHTRRAADFAGKAVTEAGEATKAANAAVEVARYTARQQLRAYVTVEPGGIARWGAHDSPHARIVARNVGSTPAYHVNVAILFYISEKPPETDITGEPLIAMDGDMTIVPGGQRNLAAHRNANLSNIEFFDVFERQKWAVVAGRVEYRDAFGDTQTTSFCHLYQGETLSADLVRYHHLGNSAT